MNPIQAEVLIFGIHRTTAWWQYLGNHLGWARAVVVTDLRGEGDISIVDDFYEELGRLKQGATTNPNLLSQIEQEDVIARCRALRWLDAELARYMVQAMAVVMERLLVKVQPKIVMSFPIDRYVKDILARLAARKGIRYVELTASVVPGMSMLLERGHLIEHDLNPSEDLVERSVNLLATPSFTPSYVPRKSTYTRMKFLRTLGYFRARALAFRMIARLMRDPLNLHYIDAQPYLGHKCRWKDMRVVGLCDSQWRTKTEVVPQSRRVLFGLQLFPEASIDYWIRERELIDHENLVFEAARAFTEAGYLVLVKDHPLQFGFRQTELLDRLLALTNVVLVPYDVSGNELMQLVDTNFTFTGTLGMQAALLGKKSVATNSYYTNDSDFIIFRNRAQIAGLPQRVESAATVETGLKERQRRIIRKLLRGSIEGDFFSFKHFDASQPPASALMLAQNLGRRLQELVAQQNR